VLTHTIEAGRYSVHHHFRLRRSVGAPTRYRARTLLVSRPAGPAPWRSAPTLRGMSGCRPAGGCDDEW